MTPPPVKPAPAKSPAKPAPGTPPPRAAKARTGFLTDDPIAIDILPGEEAERRRYAKLLKIVFIETLAIASLTGFLIFTLPVYHPIYQYFARNPDGQSTPLVALDVPNMTNRAVLSWAVTSVTEILTIGFGDFEKKLLTQKFRFTPSGWESFTGAFDNLKTGKTFLEDQLVLTTVASDTAVIIAQGVNEDGVYQWKVQIPVIMTYATNNNVTRRNHTLITLTIERVWPEQSPAGIAIRTWS
jgi:hypothetical protein